MNSTLTRQLLIFYIYIYFFIFLYIRNNSNPASDPEEDDDFEVEIIPEAVASPSKPVTKASSSVKGKGTPASAKTSKVKKALVQTKC